jgi:multiple antibiotic resistance protein
LSVLLSEAQRKNNPIATPEEWAWKARWSMLIILKSFGLSFSALLPLINPLGSALIFLEIVGDAPTSVFRYLARRIAFTTVLFLLIIEGGGAVLLAFFGISLPVVQVAGGLTLAAMGWGLLNEKGKENATPAPDTETSSAGPLEDKIFYPLTFPITAGPGCLAVTVTLSAHASRQQLINNVFAHVGIALAIVGSGITVFLCYAYAPKITQKIRPHTVRGILRVIAFVLLCIGVQIAWNGVEALAKTLLK